MLKVEDQIFVESSTPRRRDSISKTWAQTENKNNFCTQSFCSTLSFPSRAGVHPLEQVHMKLMKQVKGIPINTHFVESMAQVPEYAKFLQD